MTSQASPSQPSTHECEFCGSTNTRVLAAIDHALDGTVLAVLCGCNDCDCAFVVEHDGQSRPLQNPRLLKPIALPLCDCKKQLPSARLSGIIPSHQPTLLQPLRKEPS